MMYPGLASWLSSAVPTGLSFENRVLTHDLKPTPRHPRLRGQDRGPAITIAGCVPCSAAPLGSPLEEGAAPVGLRAALLAAGARVGRPHGRRGPSGCLPPPPGRSHFRPRAQPQ